MSLKARILLWLVAFIVASAYSVGIIVIVLFVLVTGIELWARHGSLQIRRPAETESDESLADSLVQVRANLSRPESIYNGKRLPAMWRPIHVAQYCQACGSDKLKPPETGMGVVCFHCGTRREEFSDAEFAEQQAGAHHSSSVPPREVVP
jgi:hypothetical protein